MDKQALEALVRQVLLEKLGETPAEMKAVAETPAETKAVAETSLTKAVEMTVERLQRRQALLMLLKFIKIRR